MQFSFSSKLKRANSGTCDTCVCKLEKGEVCLKRNFVLSEVHRHQGLILACVSVPI
ncbi:MAG: hypothetical protein DI622_07310 [Chryseobacterium sp.]|uniref:2Fe-2S iron-sulfur cluster-binding protein n=1 Tax=unclassified Chryseobacterium TaxID=2593645 RepID=UPI000DB805F7|nr:2Fe-2S iron-sulfur cluster binding domain-containing protein [Chryseobacterium sp.]PZU21061.1 MAG: hypothetical protein DI622_07310 [Chryseobacterium sp.]